MDEMSLLELFKRGARSKKALEKYTRTFRKVVCEIMKDILKGDFEERVTELVKRSKKDPEWTLTVLPKISEKPRARTELPKDHKDYLNPMSFKNYFQSIKNLSDMCSVAISWHRIYATYLELDNVTDSRGCTREEIAKMLQHTYDLMDLALVLVLSSSGMRAGGLALTWEDMTPIYRVDGRWCWTLAQQARDSVCDTARIQWIF